LCPISQKTSAEVAAGTWKKAGRKVRREPGTYIVMTQFCVNVQKSELDRFWTIKIRRYIVWPVLARFVLGITLARAATPPSWSRGILIEF
jgi:hypothetical protein